jgi:hypothetical protein
MRFFLQTGGKFYLNMIFTFKNISIFVVFKKKEVKWRVLNNYKLIY